MSYSGKGKNTFHLLDGVALSVQQGKVTAIIGGNGSGKTTLFNIVSGFERDYSGRVLFQGKNITHLSPHRISRMGIGRLFQGRQLMEGLTLKENLMIASKDTSFELPFASLLPRKWIKKNEAKKEENVISMLVKLFGPDNEFLKKLDLKASELSFGEQRLMALVRLLMGDYSLLLLDEPPSGINPGLHDVFRDVIRNMVDKEGKTIVMIEHNMGFVRTVADSCHYLADGAFIKRGNVAEILDDPTIRKDYLGL